MSSNIDIAKEICECDICTFVVEGEKTCEHCVLRRKVMEMADRKDEQFKKVLKALGEKGSAQDFWSDVKPLDSDISKIVSDKFWKMV